MALPVPSTLAPPLTPAVRAQIMAQTILWWAKSKGTITHQTITGASDEQLIALYTAYYDINTQIPGLQTPGKAIKDIQLPSALQSWDDVAKALGNKNTWIRVGEFAIGAILLAVAANAVFKPNIANAIPAVRTINKAVGTKSRGQKLPNTAHRSIGVWPS